MMVPVDRIIAQQRETAELQRRPEGTMKFNSAEGPPLQHSPPVASLRASKEPATSGLKSSIDSIKNRILLPKSPFGSKPTPVELQTPGASAVRLLPDRSRTMTPTRDIGVCYCHLYSHIILSIFWWQRKICSLLCLLVARRAATGSKAEAR